MNGEFATVLQQAEQSAEADANDTGLIQQFIGLCEAKLQNTQLLQESYSFRSGDMMDYGEDEDSGLLQQERNTWMLFADLLAARKQQSRMEMDTTDTEIKMHDDRTIASIFQSSDSVVRELVVVKEWLEKIAPSPNPADLADLINHAQSFIEATRSARGEKQYCRELDPDGCLRTGSSLHPDDLLLNSRIVRVLFELVRQGEMGQALDLCRKCNCFWRAASLQGGIYYSDPNATSDVFSEGNYAQGNRNRGLWMMTCFQIANCSSFDQFERAMYAALCGNTVNVLPVCTNWEDMVWAYFNSTVINETENHLRKFPRIRDDEYTDFSIPEIEDLNPEQIFERIRKCSDETISYECETLFRQIQTAFILNRFDELLEEFLEAIIRENISEPRYLRFFAHAVLVLKSTGMIQNEETANNVVSFYVELLIKTGNNELALFYASKLPYDLQIKQCAVLFQGIRGSLKSRDPILKLAYKYGLDVKAATKTAVSEIMSIYETSQFPAETTVAFESKVEDRDQYQIDMVLWLLVERELALEAIIHCNALYRRFLISGKLNAAMKLYKTLLTENPHFGSAEFVQAFRKSFGGDKYENLIREHTNFGLLLDSLFKYNEWQNIWRRHIEKGAVKLFTIEDDLKHLIEAVIESFENALNSSKLFNWLQDDDELQSILPAEFNSEKRREEMMILRQVYIPRLVFDFHDLLFQTRIIMPKNLQRSLDLAYKVASETRRMYLEFLPVDQVPETDPRHSNRCERLLMLMRESWLETFKA